MAEHDCPDATTMLNQIDAVLPKEKRRASDVLLIASAAKAIDIGLSDTQAVTGFIAALQGVRARQRKMRSH